MVSQSSTVRSHGDGLERGRKWISSWRPRTGPKAGSTGAPGGGAAPSAKAACGRTSARATGARRSAASRCAACWSGRIAAPPRRPPCPAPRSRPATAGATTRRIPPTTRPVRLPHPARHERMWRDDALYDLVIVIGHNDDPPVPGLGSAVFIHLWRGPTGGRPRAASPSPGPTWSICSPSPPPATRW